MSLVATALGRIDPGLFRRIVLGGARPPDDLPANVTTTYGMTETGSGVVYDGRPLDGVEVRIGPDGEIALRGPMLLRCYRDDLDPKDGQGWLATGDLGAWVGSGEGARLVVHGRAGDLIITGGENVWPEPVEAVLATAEGVAEVAWPGGPTPSGASGSWPSSCRAMPPGRRRWTQLRAVAKERLPAFAAPRELVLVDALPRTALGKVQRGSLP